MSTKYTDDYIREILLRCHEKELTSADVYDKYGTELKAVSKRLGGLNTICENLDIPKFSRRKVTNRKITWTDDKIAEGLRLISEKEGNFSSNYLKGVGYRSLVDAVKRRYGSWNEGLKALGYEIAYETPKYNWTKERVKEETMYAIIEGEAPTLTALSARIRGYHNAVNKLFNGFDEVKEFCGICAIKDAPKPNQDSPKAYRPDLQSKQGLKREIVRLYYVGCPLNYNAISKKKSHLLVSAKQLFGDWRSAVEYCGMNYNDVSVTDNVRAECGEEFEIVLGEILTELGVTFEKYAHERFDPDFVLSNGNWIDAKLSEWTDVSETVKRYLPECNELTIVYLVGSKRERHRGKKYCYKHINAYLLTDKLSGDKRTYYNDRLKEIENKLTANEVGSHSA